jgi:hypothetical protein
MVFGRRGNEGATKHPHNVDRTPSSTLLLLGGARAAAPVTVDMAIQALSQAGTRGIRTHVVAQAGELAAAPGLIAAADAVSAVESLRPETTVGWARRWTAGGGRIDAVFAVLEMHQVAVAETARAIRSPGNDPDVVRCVRTKDLCRAALAAAGFPQPTVRRCSTPDEAEKSLRKAAGPWIVKPRDSMGSLGVSLVSGPVDLLAAVARLPDPGSFLVETFVEGPEFSVEGIFLRGIPKILAITAKEKTPPPFFVEVAHTLPADLPAETRREIERQVSAALTVLGLRIGAFHVELWLTPTGVVLGEIHARLGGDWIHRMLAYAIPGLEVFGLVWDDILLGRATPDRCLDPVRGAAIRYLTPPPGRLVAVIGWAEAREHPSVLHAELAVAPGDVIPAVHKSSDRAGFLLVGAETPARARQLADELSSSVEFVVDPGATA